ncbi:hypothetical protein RB653_006167 [Dictyostelium firmibasis]|uniref:Flavin-containing monooxygenase n=1 Tax=Dictyostelium firmibasis TaxID=79012 RepID=A0AAN7YTJ3_9MYCE
MEMNKKKIAIIGAGASGLTSCKSALENGLEPTVFERGSKVGGLWSEDKNIRKVWDDMQTNISKYSVCFSDFPHYKSYSEDEIFPNNKSVYKYFYDYCIEFDLLKHIKFNSSVTKITREYTNNNNNNSKSSNSNSNSNISNNEFKWKIIINNKESEFELFDFLIVSTGVFSKPQEIPKILNDLKSFKGRISYSQEYRNSEAFKDKKVVILGTSYSGCEIAAELSNVTSSCIIVGQENKWVIKKFLPNNNGKLVPLDFLFFNRARCYEGLQLSIEQRWDRRNKAYSKLCPLQDPKVTPNSKLPVKYNELSNSNKENIIKPVFAIISENYVDQVEKGLIKAYSGNGFKIVESLLDGNSLKFQNDLGEIHIEEGIDEIILCNGYRLELDFLEQDILQEINFLPSDSFQPLILYKNLFPPKTKNLAFISLYRGPFLTECELFSRWATKVFSGKLNYPTNQDIENDLKIQLERRLEKPRPQFPILDFIHHCELIAKEIGCLPDFKELEKSDKELYNILWSDSFFCSASYRLIGDGAKPEFAKSILLNYYENYKKLQK